MKRENAGLRRSLSTGNPLQSPYRYNKGIFTYNLMLSETQNGVKCRFSRDANDGYFPGNLW
ncbi:MULTISPECIES: hypothetical protein [Limnospira]|uniref:hypothetical protein n=1 Tax=Limnospira TaxID=2596745 RepID=UPI000D3A89F6|nr:hypothetical protein HFV01_11590 [Limnospira fusiformis SAG 85.79]RAQ38922.1 hypothetical protein B9S53_24635 [Arthrospira sp. O9.13F]